MSLLLRLLENGKDEKFIVSNFGQGSNPLQTYRRVLDVLSYMVRSNPKLAIAACRCSEISVPVHGARQTTKSCSALDKGKRKIDDVDRDDRDVSVIHYLLSLLGDPFFGSLLDSLLSLVETILSNVEMHFMSEEKHKPRDSDAGAAVDTKKDTGAAENRKDSAGINPASGEAAQDAPEGDMVPSKPSLSDFEMIVKEVSELLTPEEIDSMPHILARDGFSHPTTVYSSAVAVMMTLATVHSPIRAAFMKSLSTNAIELAKKSTDELKLVIPSHAPDGGNDGNDSKAGTTALSGFLSRTCAGIALLRIVQAIQLLIQEDTGDGAKKPAGSASGSVSTTTNQLSKAAMDELSRHLEPLWETLSDGAAFLNAGMMSHAPARPQLPTPSLRAAPLPAATAKVLPLVETFFVLSEIRMGGQEQQQQQQPKAGERASDAASSRQSLGRGTADVDLSKEPFVAFAERFRPLINSIIRQDPRLIEGSFKLLLKCTRLIDFDNKRAVYRNRILQQNEERRHYTQRFARICVRREFVLDDSYHQLRLRSPEELRGRLTVQFQGEEGIDAGGLMREWYYILAREIFDQNKALLISADGGLTFQPNPNSGVNPEHLSYFKFIGRIVAKALYDGQLLDAHFTRSFYKHILGVPITYEDIEAIDPQYFKNLAFILEHDLKEIGMDHLTFSVEADEQQRELFGNTKDQVIDLIPNGRDVPVTEDRKREYVNLVAEHRMTTSIKPQISTFLEGFDELITRDVISIFNEKELELLISGLPTIDLDDLRANTEYNGYESHAPVIQWFWEIVNEMNKEDVARFLMFCTGTTKVPLDGFKALEGVTGPQRFQVHKAFGKNDRLPTAHTCYNQLDMIEYPDKETLKKRLYTAILEGSEGFSFH